MFREIFIITTVNSLSSGIAERGAAPSSGKWGPEHPPAAAGTAEAAGKVEAAGTAEAVGTAEAAGIAERENAYPLAESGTFRFVTRVAPPPLPSIFKEEEAGEEEDRRVEEREEEEEENNEPEFLLLRPLIPHLRPTEREN